MIPLKIATGRSNFVNSYESNEEFQYQYKDLRIDTLHKGVFVKGKKVFLNLTEYKILRVLVKYAGSIVPYNTFYKEIWKGKILKHHKISTYMTNLKHKLDDQGIASKYIFLKLGIGYGLSCT